MERGSIGRYMSSIAGGVKCQAFFPAAISSQPPFLLGNKLQGSIYKAMLALDRLDATSTLLPDVQLFLYSYVRKEAIMSSQIEGTQSTLSDLMPYVMEGLPGVPMGDMQEVSCYVSALELGAQRIREGYPITFRLPIELHKALMTSGRGISKGPGEFRKNQVWVGGYREAEANFVPTPANEQAECWVQLKRFLNDILEETDPLIKTALAQPNTIFTIKLKMQNRFSEFRLTISLMLA